MPEIIWVMDSDLCDTCGALLGYFGECPECGYGDGDWDDCDREEEYADEEKLSTEEELYFLQEYYRQEARASSPTREESDKVEK